MVVATFDPIVELLTKAGVVKAGPGYPTFDVQAYLDLAAKGTRWDQLPGNTSYPVLFGESATSEMERVAKMSGGKVFDARDRSLAAAFKEIRGYQ
jgi:hypothetical protein